MDNDFGISETTKDLIRVAMEYHIIVLKNLKKIKASV
jgi:hypothetical protein